MELHDINPAVRELIHGHVYMFWGLILAVIHIPRSSHTWYILPLAIAVGIEIIESIFYGGHPIVFKLMHVMAWAVGIGAGWSICEYIECSTIKHLSKGEDDVQRHNESTS
jgi:hypothetical protein